MSLNKIRVTILGSGTSQGIPVIGCTCDVCLSADPKDKRLRTSILLSSEQSNVVIDVGPDFRQQMLREGIASLDAAVITHEHNDHIIGLDDIRPFNFMRRMPLTVFATKRVQSELMDRFKYIFDINPYPGAPRVALSNIDPDSVLEVGDFELRPIKVMHGFMPVLGFRVNDFTYITDAKTIEPEELNKAKYSDTLILNALHHKPHHSHLNLSEALELIAFLKPRQAYLTHISHNMGRYEDINKTLPENVSLAFDGLSFEI